MKKFFQRIWYWIKDLKYLPRNIIVSIKNLIVWFPLIWRDRQWDYIFIYRILHKKLSLMEKFIRKDGIHVRNIQDADKMKTCILLLERLMNDIYHDQAFKKHYEKWGDPLMRFIDCEHEDCHEIIFDYKNVKTEKDEKQKTKEFRRCIKHEEYLMKQDSELLFKMLHKHIRTWWD